MQHGSTIHETSVLTEEGSTAILSSVQTIFVPSCSTPIGPVSVPTTVTETLRGATYTSFVTAPGFNHSIVVASMVTTFLPGSTLVTTAPGERSTVTEYETETLPGSTFTASGGSATITEFATRTLPGSTITVITGPGENATITSIETTTCYETISKCNTLPPVGPVSIPSVTTIYATSYVTRTLPTTLSVGTTCEASTVTITLSSDGWSTPTGYGPHGGPPGSWSNKPSQEGGALTASSTKSTGYWRRA